MLCNRVFEDMNCVRELSFLFMLYNLFAVSPHLLHSMLIYVLVLGGGAVIEARERPYLIVAGP